MKIHNISIAGFIMGLAICTISIIQWFFRFYDPSQLLFGVGGGFVICSFAYIYNWMRCKDERDNKDKEQFQKDIDNIFNRLNEKNVEMLFK